MATATMPPTKKSAAPAAPQLTESLDSYINRRYGLIHVIRSQWRGNYQIRGIEQMVDGKLVSKGAMKAGVTQIIPPLWEKRFAKVYTRVGHVVDQFSRPFEAFRGLRVIPLTHPTTGEDLYAEFNKKLAVETEALARVTADFAAAYKTDILDRAAAIWIPILGDERYQNELARKLPTPASLSGRFRITVCRFGIAAMDGGAKEAVAGAVNSLIEGPRKELEAGIEQLLIQLGAVCEHCGAERAYEDICAKCKGTREPKRLTANSFTATLNALRQLELFPEFMDEDLLARSKRLSQHIESLLKRADARVSGMSFADATNLFLSDTTRLVKETVKAAIDEDKIAAIRSRFGAVRGFD